MRFGADEKKHRQNLILFILISLGLHVLVIFFAPVQLTPKQKEEEPLYVEINPKDLQQLANEQRKQIVNSEDSANKTPAKDAKYLSDKSQSVAEETKAKNVDSFQKGGAKGERAFQLKNFAPRPYTAETPKENTHVEEGDFFDAKKKQQQQAQTQQGDNGNAKGSANSDYLKDVKEGDRTVLNTKEFIYFGYYNRIRERLESSWRSKLHNALGEQLLAGRQLATSRAYITRLMVILDRHGRITSVRMKDNSGFRALDQAAVDAFNQAGPFPDPPSGLVDENGQIQIPWDFILQT